MHNLGFLAGFPRVYFTLCSTRSGPHAICDHEAMYFLLGFNLAYACDIENSKPLVRTYDLKTWAPLFRENNKDNVLSYYGKVSGTTRVPLP